MGLGIIMALGVAATPRKRQRNPPRPCAAHHADALRAPGLFFLPAPSVSMMAPMGWVGSILRFLIDLLEIPILDEAGGASGPAAPRPLLLGGHPAGALDHRLRTSWKASRQVMVRSLLRASPAS